MGKFKDYLIYREAKRTLTGKKTFFQTLHDKFIYIQAKRELKKNKGE